jgi:hypothetical protein
MMHDSRLSKLAVTSSVLSIATVPCVFHAIVPAKAWQMIIKNNPLDVFILPIPALATALIGTVAFVRVWKSDKALSGLGFALVGALISWISVIGECALLFFLSGLSPH